MKDRTAYVIGATGLLGRSVVEEFKCNGYKVFGTGLTRVPATSEIEIEKLDLQDEERLGRRLDAVKPSIVINCVANRYPAQCEAQLEGATFVNATVPANILRQASRRSIPLLHISTDYVFSGRSGEAPYKTSNVPSPVNAYGRTKLQGEEAILNILESEEGRANGARACILRVPLLYGHAPTDAGPLTREALLAEDSAVRSASGVHGVLAKVWTAQDGNTVQMDDHAIRFPTATEDIASVLVQLSERLCSSIEGAASTEVAGRSLLPNILQYSAEEGMTQYGLACKLADILGLSRDGLIANDNGGSNIPADGIERPFNANLDSSELRDTGVQAIGIKFDDWWRRELRAFR